MSDYAYRNSYGATNLRGAFNECSSPTTNQQLSTDMKVRLGRIILTAVPIIGFAFIAVSILVILMTTTNIHFWIIQPLHQPLVLTIIQLGLPMIAGVGAVFTGVGAALLPPNAFIERRGPPIRKGGGFYQLYS